MTWTEKNGKFFLLLLSSTWAMIATTKWLDHKSEQSWLMGQNTAAISSFSPDITPLKNRARRRSKKAQRTKEQNFSLPKNILKKKTRVFLFLFGRRADYPLASYVLIRTPFFARSWRSTNKQTDRRTVHNFPRTHKTGWDALLLLQVPDIQCSLTLLVWAENFRFSNFFLFRSRSIWEVQKWESVRGVILDQMRVWTDRRTGGQADRRT